MCKILWISVVFFFICLSFCVLTYVCAFVCPGHGTVCGSDLPVLHCCGCNYFHCNVSSGWGCPAFHKESGKNTHIFTHITDCAENCASPTRRGNVYLLNLNNCNMTRVLFFFFSLGHYSDDYNGSWNTSWVRRSGMNWATRRNMKHTKTVKYCNFICEHNRVHKC